MTDLEITKLCAVAMGLDTKVAIPTIIPLVSGLRGSACYAYCPLHDDAQAMALVKKFYLKLGPRTDNSWCVRDKSNSGVIQADSYDLNRAICECVAKM